MSEHFFFWWEREEAEQNCDHEMIDLHCQECGGYCGNMCQLCGMESDGGDFMSQFAGCTCPNGPTLEDD